MGSADFRHQFSHALAVLEAAKVGYVHLVDGLAFGFHNLGAPFVYTHIYLCRYIHVSLPLFQPRNLGPSRSSGPPFTLRDARQAFTGALIGTPPQDSRG
jgi:hypothetical protein